MVAQIVTHILAQRMSDRVRRRDRFDEAMRLLWEFESWVDADRNHAQFGSAEPKAPNPFSKLMTIAVMDFPRIVPDLDDLRTKQLEFSIWYKERGMERLRRNIEGLGDGAGNAYQPFYRTMKTIENSMRDIARSLD